MFERVPGRRGLHASITGHLQELVPVLPGEIGNRADFALFPEKFIGELRDVAHVDTAANDAAGLAHGLERERHERADRGEDDRRIEWYRRQFLGGAGPGGAEPARHLLARLVAGAGEGEDLATLPAQH